MILSIAIATYNEEKNIIHCLKSVYDWVDEIVVIDGTSTDKTVDLIKQFDKQAKARIFIKENPPMFHINKQKAVEKCTKDWILQLDADEVVSEELKNEIKLILTNSTNFNQFQPIAFWLPRFNFFLGKPLKKGGQYPDYTIRLYRNGVARFPCKSVHEQVEISQELVKVGQSWSKVSKKPIKPTPTNSTNSNQFQPISILNSPLLHYPYPTFSEYINKWNRYTTQEAEILKKQRFKPSFFNFIKYFCILPKLWFLKTYFRHLGFLDGFPGFVFSLFSAIRYWGIYVKLFEKPQ